MVLAEFAAVDQAEVEWRVETFHVSDHQDTCRVCSEHGPCATYEALRTVERQMWGRFYDARLDAGVLPR
jgi:hypothetical protein